MYSIKILCDRANISENTFYRLLREESAFAEIAKSNREKKGKGYRYGEPVLSWLLAYYDNGENNQPSQPAQATPTEEKPAPEPAPSVAQDAPSASIDDTRLKALEEENKALKATIDKLEKALADNEEERKALFNQNGHLLLLLAQEKAEKQLFLPAPKLTMREKWHNFWHKEDKPQKSKPIDTEPIVESKEGKSK